MAEQNDPRRLTDSNTGCLLVGIRYQSKETLEQSDSIQKLHIMKSNTGMNEERVRIKNFEDVINKAGKRGKNRIKLN